MEAQAESRKRAALGNENNEEEELKVDEKDQIEFEQIYIDVNKKGSKGTERKSSIDEEPLDLYSTPEDNGNDPNIWS